jgi:hypothetical protein
VAQKWATEKKVSARWLRSALFSRCDATRRAPETLKPELTKRLNHKPFGKP